MVERLGTACAIFAAALLAASMLVICWMVLYRAIGRQNEWELELSIMMMVAAIFLASPYTLRTKGHVGMEFLDAVFSDRAKQRLALAGDVIGLLVCLYLAWTGLVMTAQAFRLDERSLGIVRMVEWPKYAAMPIGMGLTALQYAVQVRSVWLRMYGKARAVAG